MRFLIVAALFAVAFAATGQNAQLSADAARLKQLAQSEIQKLAAQGKGLLAKELQVLENEIIAVEKKLASLKPNTELGRIGVNALESILKSLETKLEAELKRLSNTGAYYEATKQALAGDVAKLKKLAETEIQKLAAQGKGLLAKEIKVLENEIIGVEKKLASVNPSTEVGKIAISSLKTVLKGLENKLEAEIKKLGGAFYESTKQALTADAEKLKKLAQAKILKLEKEGKSLLAKEIKVLENEIIAVEKQVASVNPSTEVGKVVLSALKTALKGLENKLEAEIKKLGGAFYESTKKALTADAERLKKLAQAKISKLEKEGKSLLAKEIKVLENEIIGVEKKLASVNPSTEVGKIAISSLKTVLKGLENKLEAEIKKLGGK